MHILQAEGDAILAFWTKPICDDHMKVIETLLGLNEVLSQISEQLNDEELLVDTDIKIRGAVIDGDIRPIWREIGDTRIPAWIEAGSQNIFVDAARFLDFEKEYSHLHQKNGEGSRSVFVFLSSKADLLKNSNPKYSECWVDESLWIKSKNEVTYEVSLFSPEFSKGRIAVMKRKNA